MDENTCHVTFWSANPSPRLRLTLTVELTLLKVKGPIPILQSQESPLVRVKLALTFPGDVKYLGHVMKIVHLKRVNELYPVRQIITCLFIEGMVPHRLHKVPPAKDPCKKCKFPKTFCSRDKNGTAECLCPQFCTREFAPVCGTDGRNYSNKCQLEVEACKPENIRTLKVKHLGPCGK